MSKIKTPSVFDTENYKKYLIQKEKNRTKYQREHFKEYSKKYLSFTLIQENIRLRCNKSTNESKYIVKMKINKTYTEKTFDILEEAIEFKKILLKRRELIKRLKETKKKTKAKELMHKKINVIRTRVEQNIRKVYRKTNGTTRYMFHTNKNAIQIEKSFETLIEAQEYKKEIECIN